VREGGSQRNNREQASTFTFNAKYSENLNRVLVVVSVRGLTGGWRKSHEFIDLYC
jgi:hypothetical protein